MSYPPSKDTHAQQPDKFFYLAQKKVTFSIFTVCRGTLTVQQRVLTEVNCSSGKYSVPVPSQRQTQTPAFD